MSTDKSKKIALERIKILFEEAEKEFKKNPERSNRYVEIARKISMKTKTKIPSELKRKFCKYCKKYLVPGVNLRVRMNKSRVIYNCLNCGKVMRFSVLKEKNGRITKK